MISSFIIHNFADNSQFFRVVPNGNSVTIELNTTISLEVLENHEQLIFVIRADKPGSITARAAIVISLVKGKNTNQSN